MASIAHHDLHWKYVGPTKAWLDRLRHVRYAVPTVTSEAFGRHFRELDEPLERALGDAKLANSLAALDKCRHGLCGSDHRLVWVLSSGHCGTLALKSFLLKAATVRPFHRSNPAPTPPEVRNELFYRFLLGRIDQHTLRRLALRLLTARFGQITQAAVEGKHYCHVAHEDTEFAPIIARLFPEARFIYLKRDFFDTFLSLYEKVKRLANVSPYYVDPTLKGRNFFGLRPPWGRTREIVWYLHGNETFVTAFLHTLDRERWLEIRSENMFAGEVGAYQALNSVLPLADLDHAAFQDHFRQPVNSKPAIYPTDEPQRAALKDKVMRLRAALQRNGSF